MSAGAPTSELRVAGECLRVVGERGVLGLRGVEREERVDSLESCVCLLEVEVGLVEGTVLGEVFEIGEVVVDACAAADLEHLSIEEGLAVSVFELEAVEGPGFVDLEYPLDMLSDNASVDLGFLMDVVEEFLEVLHEQG